MVGKGDEKGFGDEEEIIIFSSFKVLILVSLSSHIYLDSSLSFSKIIRDLYLSFTTHSLSIFQFFQREGFCGMIAWHFRCVMRGLGNGKTEDVGEKEGRLGGGRLAVRFGDGGEGGERESRMGEAVMGVEMESRF